MSQGWNRQLQNMQRLIDEYAKMINLKDQGFQLGESSDLRRPGNFTLGETGSMKTGKTVPTVYQQPSVQPQAALPGRNTISLPASQKPLLLTTSGKPLPNQSSVINLGGDVGQMAYKLPDGTYTSNKDLVKYARQQVAKSRRMALPGIIAKGAGVLSTAIPFYKDVAFPVAKDLYQGFIMGNPEESKTLQAALNLAGIDKNGNRIPKKPNNTSTNNGNNTSGSTGTNGVKGNGSMGGQSTTQAQALALAQQLGDNPAVANQQDADTQQANMQAINNYISKLQEINQPYINSLQKYMDNYNDMLDQRQRAARFWQGAASLTGNPAWANIGRQYDALTNEANKVAIIKQIQDAQTGDVNAINEVMGNLALAKELNLPPEAAFANKNLLTALTANRRQLTDLEKAQIMADIRKYGYDSAFARALQVQGMKGQNALDVARTYMGGGVAPGLNNQGLPQTPYQPLANRQQGGSNLQQAFDMYANK